MTPTYVKPNFVNPYSGRKAQNYACQICRAPREICARCVIGKQVASMPDAASVTARRVRPRATLAQS